MMLIYIYINLLRYNIMLKFKFVTLPCCNIISNVFLSKYVIIQYLTCTFLHYYAIIQYLTFTFLHNYAVILRLEFIFFHCYAVILHYYAIIQYLEFMFIILLCYYTVPCIDVHYITMKLYNT